MNSIIIRVDGNSKIGLGHIYRMIAFAGIILERYKVIFAINSPSEQVTNLLNLNKLEFVDVNTNGGFDFFTQVKKSVNPFCVVLDGYHFDSNYQKRLKELGYKVISIDGVYSTHFYSDAVINYNLHADADKYIKQEYTKLFLGPDYCFLRGSFLEAAERKSYIDYVAENLTIMFGGSDQYNLTLKTLELLHKGQQISNFNHINLICGNSFEHIDILQSFIECYPNLRIKLFKNLDDNELIKVFSRSKVAIVPGGYSLYEIFSIGVPVITGYYVDNQMLNAESVENKMLGVSVGNFKEMTSELLSEKIQDTLIRASVYRSEQRKVFNGKQREMISEIICDLCQG